MNENFKKPLTLKQRLANFSIIVFIFWLLFQAIRPKNEIGFIGADKGGRQFFIQSLNELSKPYVEITSDFYDRPLLLKIILGGSMITTIRFDYRILPDEKPNAENLRKYLDSPYDGKIVDSGIYAKEVYLQENVIYSLDKFKEKLKDKNVNTMEDFFAGYGFKKYEVYIAGELAASADIRNTRNIKHLGFE